MCVRAGDRTIEVQVVFSNTSLPSFPLFHSPSSPLPPSLPLASIPWQKLKDTLVVDVLSVKMHAKEVEVEIVGEVEVDGEEEVEMVVEVNMGRKR